MIDVNYITDAVGIDKAIQNVQRKLQSRIAWTGYKAFGRTYRIERNAKQMPCLYLRNSEYYEMLPDDNEIAFSFFDVDSDVTHGNIQNSTCEVDLIYFVNIERVYNNLTHRADENVINDVLNVLKVFGDNVTVLSHNIIDPLQNFDYDKNIAEMHPFLVFSVRLELKYTYTQCRT